MASETLTITTRVVDQASSDLQEIRRTLQDLGQPVEIRVSLNHQLPEFEQDLDRVFGQERTIDVAVNRDAWDTLRQDIEQPLNTEVIVDTSAAEREASSLGQRFERELQQAVDVVSNVTINVQGGGGGIPGLDLIPGLGGLPIPGLAQAPPAIPFSARPLAVAPSPRGIPAQLPSAFTAPIPTPTAPLTAQLPLGYDRPIDIPTGPATTPGGRPIPILTRGIGGAGDFPPAPAPAPAPAVIDEEDGGFFDFDFLDDLDREDALLAAEIGGIALTLIPGVATVRRVAQSGQLLSRLRRRLPGGRRAAQAEQAAQAAATRRAASEAAEAQRREARRVVEQREETYLDRTPRGSSWRRPLRDDEAERRLILQRGERQAQGAENPGRRALEEAEEAARLEIEREQNSLFPGLGRWRRRRRERAERRGYNAGRGFGRSRRPSAQQELEVIRTQVEAGERRRRIQSRWDANRRALRERQAAAAAAAEEAAEAARLGRRQRVRRGLLYGAGATGAAVIGGGNYLLGGAGGGGAGGGGGGAGGGIGEAFQFFGGQQDVRSRLGDVLAGDEEELSLALEQIAAITGLSDTQAERLLLIVGQGDPRLVDDAVDLYLLYENALADQNLGRVPAPEEVLQAIYEGRQEEGALFAFAESGGVPGDIADIVSQPRLEGEFSRALGLDPSITVAPDDIGPGAFRLYRSIVTEATEEAVGSARGSIRRRALSNREAQVGRSIQRLIANTQDERLRARLRGAETAVAGRDPTLAGQEANQLAILLQQLSEAGEAGALTPDIVNVIQGLRGFERLTPERFRSAEQALAPLIRDYQRPTIALGTTRGGIAPPQTELEAVTENIQAQADRREALVGFREALEGSGFTRGDVGVEVQRLFGITPAELEALGAQEPGAANDLRQRALDRLLRERSDAARAAGRPQRSAFGDSARFLGGGFRRQDLVGAPGRASRFGDASRFLGGGASTRDFLRSFRPAEGAAVAPLGPSANDLALQSLTQTLSRGAFGVGTGQESPLDLAAAGGGAYLGTLVGTAIGGPLGGIAGNFVGGAATRLLEEANSWLSGIFGNTAAASGPRPEEAAFGPQVGSVSVAGAQPIVVETTVNIMGDVNDQVDFEAAVETGVAAAFNNSSELGLLRQENAVNPNRR